MQEDPKNTEKGSIPLFCPIEHPIISSIGHGDLVKWNNARIEYVNKVNARVKGTGEDANKLLVSVKDSFKHDFLKLCCDLEFGLDASEVTDDQLMEKISEIISSVKNDIDIDLDALFASKLKINLKETDVKQRIIDYFGQFRKLCHEHGIQKSFEDDQGGKNRTKII